jgi:bleomycin hydrolase
LFFWDKLNKANYYLELSIEHADLPIDDRLISHLSAELVSDGGQWDMSVNLIEGYGIVPQSIYPESVHSSLSGPLNALVKTKLREHALILRRLSSSLRAACTPEDILRLALRAKKQELMKEVYNILTATLGVPPNPDEGFVWDYINADGKVARWEGTPLEYFQVFAAKPYPVCAHCDVEVRSMVQFDSSSLPSHSHSSMIPVTIIPNCTWLISWGISGAVALCCVS